MSVSNLFGEDLQDNLPERTLVVIASSQTNKRGYNKIPDESISKVFAVYKMKKDFNPYFRDSRFIIWVDVTLSKYYWERSTLVESFNTYKFGPFETPREAILDILSLYGINEHEIERVD